MKHDDYSGNIKELDAQIRKLSQDGQFVEWLKKEITKYNPHWKKCPKDEAQFYLLSRTVEMLETINEVAPTDAKAYAENKLRLDGYKSEFSIILEKINAAKPKDSKKMDELEAKYLELQKRIRKNDSAMLPELEKRMARVQIAIRLKREGKSERDVHYNVR